MGSQRALFFLALVTFGTNCGSAWEEEPQDPPLPSRLATEDESGYIYLWNQPSVFFQDAGLADPHWITDLCSYIERGGKIDDKHLPHYPHYKLHRVAPVPGSLTIAIRDYTRDPPNIDLGSWTMITIAMHGDLPAEGVEVPIPKQATLLYSLEAVAFIGSYYVGCARNGALTLTGYDGDAVRIHLRAEITSKWARFDEDELVTIDDDFLLHRGALEDLLPWRQWVIERERREPLDDKLHD